MVLNRTLLLFFLLLGASFVSAQQAGQVQGKILDTTLEEPLLFANVSLKNTLWSTQTNFHGNFALEEVTPGTYTMVVTYLGYETLEIPLEVKAGETLSINKGLATLSLDSKGLIAESTLENPTGPILEGDSKASSGKDR